MGGQPVVQRLHDRAPDWTAAGILSLIPNSISQGLLGHAFTCPDLIGGGYYLPFIDPSYQLDEEFFVRYCQCSALMPMMQFSAAPWRVLTPRSNAICKAAVELHTKFSPKILELARQSTKNSEPILRSMEYVFPGNGYEAVTDQFLLGDDLLVTPVITQGATTRRVTLPPGRWRADDGQTYEGPAVVEVPSPLERLPYFVRD
jgi:alpha-glucosidase (family GH31 glycosyl hydrolase)